MKPLRGLAIFVLALPVFAQFAGPAILSRGEAPTAMVTSQVTFRPFVRAGVLYDTGLAGASVTETGGIAHESSLGLAFNWGVGGAHGWKHTKIGLDYQGGFIYYTRKTFFTGLNQSLLLGLSHQLSRHLMLTFRETGGVFSRAFVHTGLQPTVPFDPSTTYIPTTDYFDNRTYYGSSQIDLTIQKTSRLSMNMGGDAYITRRRSAALHGTTGISARGDIQYRWTRRTTIGAGYSYLNFRFTRVFGGSDIHGLAGTFAHAFSAKLELSGFAGMNRAESQFIQSVPVDPLVTALLGISTGTRVSHSIKYAPLLGVRLARTFSSGVAYLTGGHSFTPGNGLFLTTEMSSGTVGYSYTGVRRWALGVNTTYNRGRAYGTFTGIYTTTNGGLHASRTLTHGLHLLLSYSVRRYSSPDYANYNRIVHEGNISLGWAPGDVPLRFW